MTSLALPDDRVKVEFVWRNDRFAHAFVFPDGTRVDSIEGDAADAWPPSPPLQQLSLEQLNDADVILGVGAAGSGHWSVSVEVVRLDQHIHAFKFDFACQCKSACGFLGSSYPATARLRVHCDDNAAVDNVLVGDAQEVTRIVPQQSSAGRTVRWTYHVSAI